jgi:hypothetical protein
MREITEGKTLVHFMNFDGDIYAYFPKKQVTRDTFEAYSLAEGLTSCHKDYFNNSINATDKQSVTLRKKLKELGYKLLVKDGHKYFRPDLPMVFTF